MDKWVLARYQSLVDWSQREPAWWARQCAYLHGILDLFVFYLRGFSSSSYIFFSFLSIVVTTGMYFLSRNPTMLRVGAGGSIWIRLMMLVLFCTSALFLLLAFAIDPEYKLSALDMFVRASQFAFLSFYYIAACDSPPPPVKKHSFKLVTQGTST